MNGRDYSLLRSIIFVIILSFEIIGIVVVVVAVDLPVIDEQEQQHSFQDKILSTIQIGKSRLHYEPPFTVEHYPLTVLDALHRYPLHNKNKERVNDGEIKNSQHNIDNYDDDDDDDDDDEVNRVLLASWYVDLGIAHRTVMEDYYIEHLDPYSDDVGNNMELHDDDNVIQQHKIYAITTLQEAIDIYQNLINKYQKWLLDETKLNDLNEKLDTSNDLDDEATNILMKMVIQEYQVLLANAMFTLAETYILLNDTIHAHPYYQKAYRIYEERLVEERKMDIAHDQQIEFHFAHCSMQLGLHLIQSFNLVHDVNYDKNDGHTDTTISKLNEAIELSVVTLDSSFWMSFMKSLRLDGKDEDKSMEHTVESVYEYLMTNLFDGDIVLTEQYMIQYIQTEQAIFYFTNAVNILRIYIQQKETTIDLVETILVEHQQTLANVLQHLASCIYNYQIDYIKAIEYYEEALEIYEEHIIPKLDIEPSTDRNYNIDSELIRNVLSASDVLFALAEMYFLNGDDDTSKEKMQFCLQLYEQYQLDPPYNDPLLLYGSTSAEDTIMIENNGDRPISKKDLLIQYERTLEEYYALFNDNDFEQQHAASLNDDILSVDESDGSNIYYYDKDDGYEADLHVSIGTLYMELDNQSSSRNIISPASNHFEQAVRLYDISGEVHNTNMALAKYNLFLLHLRDGDYRKASRLYNDAIDSLRMIDSTIEHTDASTFSNGMMNEWEHQYRTLRKNQPFKSKRQLNLKETHESTNSGTKTRNYKIVTSTEENKKTASSLFIDIKQFLNQNHSSITPDDEL